MSRARSYLNQMKRQKLRRQIETQKRHTHLLEVIVDNLTNKEYFSYQEALDITKKAGYGKGTLNWLIKGLKETGFLIVKRTYITTDRGTRSYRKFYQFRELK